MLEFRMNLGGALIAAVIAVATFPRLWSAQASSINGRVLSAESGRPIGGAVVALRTARRETRTDSLGRFFLPDVRTGEQELQVLAVGYSPARATFAVTAGPPLEVDVELDPLPRVLGRVLTVADRERARNPWYGEFAGRRAIGLGRFVSREELERAQGRSLDEMLRTRVPGIRILDVGGLSVAGSARGNTAIDPRRGDARCFVQVIVDNVVRYTTGAGPPYFDLRSLDAAMIAGIEYHSVASTPTEFNRGGNAACGTLVIWLQH